MLERTNFNDEMFDVNPRERREYFDSKVRGLGARQGVSGQASYFLSYWVVRKGKKVKPRFTFGAFPAMNTKQAREEALKWREVVRAGGDPSLDKQKEKDRQKFETKHGLERAPQTVSEALELYFADVVDAPTKHGGHKNPDVTKAFYKRYFGGWYDRAIAEINKADADAILTRMKNDRGRVAANRAFTRGRVFFKWAAKKSLIETNPFADIEKPGGKEEPRDRNLFDDIKDGSPELIAVWKAAETIG